MRVLYFDKITESRIRSIIQTAEKPISWEFPGLGLQFALKQVVELRGLHELFGYLSYASAQHSKHPKDGTQMFRLYVLSGAWKGTFSIMDIKYVLNLLDSLLYDG